MLHIFGLLLNIIKRSISKTSFNQTDINNFVKRSPLHIEICIIDLGEIKKKKWKTTKKIIFKMNFDRLYGWMDGWMERKITMCVYLKNIKNRPKNEEDLCKFHLYIIHAMSAVFCAVFFAVFLLNNNNNFFFCWFAWCLSKILYAHSLVCNFTVCSLDVSVDQYWKFHLIMSWNKFFPILL